MLPLFSPLSITPFLRRFLSLSFSASADDYLPPLLPLQRHCAMFSPLRFRRQPPLIFISLTLMPPFFTLLMPPLMSAAFHDAIISSYADYAVSCHYYCFDYLLPCYFIIFTLLSLCRLFSLTLP